MTTYILRGLLARFWKLVGEEHLSLSNVSFPTFQMINWWCMFRNLVNNHHILIMWNLSFLSFSCAILNEAISSGSGLVLQDVLNSCNLATKCINSKFLSWYHIMYYFWPSPPNIKIVIPSSNIQPGLQAWGQFAREASSPKYCPVSRSCYWKEALNAGYRVLERGKWMSLLEIYPLKYWMSWPKPVS